MKMRFLSAGFFTGLQTYVIEVKQIHDIDRRKTY